MKLLSDSHKAVKPVFEVVWTDDEKRKKWSARLDLAKKLTDELELLSVKKDLRKCAVRNISASNFHNEASLIKKNYGLVTLPLSVVKMPGSIFAHYHERALPNDPNALFHCVVSKDPEFLFEYQKAYSKSDHITMGSLLGYPSCCCEAFQEVYPKGYIDPVWHSGLRSEHEHLSIENGHLLKIKKWFIFSNPIARYLGLRFSFHIPCSFSCYKSIVFGMKLKDLARSMNKDTSWYEEICYSSYWDCYRGTAIIGYPSVGLFLYSSSNMSEFRHVVYLDDGLINEEMFSSLESRRIGNEPEIRLER